ncbi:class I SAM-dependent methyltransferase [Salinicoccus bachuensis]|uniref:Class I SAM-dependent methyltransferase n=1 Tax=Salinicoccus bachuensis TaxID=3136731 RepID=A0ABZ3CHE6_9STAP
MSHYFTGDNTEHEYREIKFNYKDRTYRFRTDRGVFSRDRIDYGSSVLIDAVIHDCDLPEGGVFIDMGAGYGAIGIVLGDTLEAKPIMVEVNSDALVLCRENAEHNGVEAEVVSRTEYGAMELAERPSLYVTNPPFRAGKPVVLEMIEDAHKKLVAEGAFYMVVQKKQGMPSYRKAVEKLFGNSEIVVKDKGYYVLKGVKV